MADFQRRVGAPARGLPGMNVNPSALVTTAFNYLSDGNLEPGGFAFEAAPTGQDVCFAYKAKEGGYLLGMVVRSNTGQFNLPEVSSSGTYHMGASVTIAVRGQIEAVVPAGQTPTFKQAVLCDPATGAVTYGKAGDPNDTGWDVRFFPGQSSAQAGDLVIYENWGLRAPSKS